MFLQFQEKIPDVPVIFLRPPHNLRRDYMGATKEIQQSVANDHIDTSKKMKLMP